MASSKPQVTLHDIARLAGTSESTVSRILSGRTKATRKATAALAEKIRGLADAHKFRPSWRARSFQRGRTHQVALVYAHRNPWVGSVYADMLAGAVQTFQAHDYHLVFFQATDQGGDWRDALLERRFDGCLVHHEFPPAIRSPIRAAGLPCVLLNAKPPAGRNVDAVYPDDVSGASALTHHLVELGHRAIWFCRPLHDQPPYHFSVADREAGYTQAMRAAGLTPQAWPERTKTATPAIADAVRRARQRPTALVAYSERMGFQLLHDLHMAGIRVPKEISVAAFDDTWETTCSIPPLTVMRLPFAAMGRQAAELMLAAIAEPTRAPRQVVFAEELVQRASTAAPPAR